MAIDWNQVLSAIYIIDLNRVSSAVTAIATIGLAYYAYKSFKGVKDQMELINRQSKDMKRQADAMEIQSNLIRGQSDAMTRQADIMDGETNFVRDQSEAMQIQASTMQKQADAMKGQSDAMMLQSRLMIENMNYDRFIRNYERVSREMSILIAPLYSRRKDPHIFSLTRRSQRVVPSGGWKSGGDMIFDFVSYWDSIDQNMYLNRSYILKEAYSEYHEAIEKYFELSGQTGKSEEQNVLAKKFNDYIKPNLIKTIEKRYEEISEELKEMESEFTSLFNY